MRIEEESTVTNKKPKNGMPYKKRWIENIYDLYGIIYVSLGSVYALFCFERGQSYS